MAFPLIRLRAAEQPAVRLVFFPCSGGTSASYRSQAQSLPETYDCVAVEYPGHGRRREDPLAMSIDELAQEAHLALEDEDDVPLVFFGHSLGGAVAYETTRLLAARSITTIALLVVSGCVAPADPALRTPVAALADESILALLKKLGGTPPEVLEDEDLMRVALPVLRADLYACANYFPIVNEPIETPIHAYCGEGDPLSDHALVSRWHLYTRARFGIAHFPGSHFFLNTAWPEVAETLIAHIDAVVRSLEGNRSASFEGEPPKWPISRNA